jgi:hypothetical protein
VGALVGFLGVPGCPGWKNNASGVKMEPSIVTKPLAFGHFETGNPAENRQKVVLRKNLVSAGFLPVSGCPLVGFLGVPGCPGWKKNASGIKMEP